MVLHYHPKGRVKSPKNLLRHRQPCRVPAPRTQEAREAVEIASATIIPRSPNGDTNGSQAYSPSSAAHSGRLHQKVQAGSQTSPLASWGLTSSHAIAIEPATSAKEVDGGLLPANGSLRRTVLRGGCRSCSGPGASSVAVKGIGHILLRRWSGQLLEVAIPVISRQAK